MRPGLLALLFAFAALPATHAATTAHTLQPADLRADKLPSASVLRKLPAGAAAEVLSLEGGWAWVTAAGTTGWVRASALDLQVAPASASLADSGRSRVTEPIGTLGVRGMPPRSNRHALIIGISQYAGGEVMPLPGARIDRESATQMAKAMSIPAADTTYLEDAQATSAGIRKALHELDASVQDGDRVFIHYSGHGTRFLDPAAGGCTEGLLAYEAGAQGTISHREMAQLLAPIARKTDKLFVMYDACYSGGAVPIDLATRTRGLLVEGDEGRLRPRFAPSSEECARPSNVKTRNLVVEAVAQGVLAPDIVHLSSSREDEISFDDEQKGGLATQFVRDCMLRDAVDTDGSGAITVDEIRQCAQKKIDKRLEKDSQFKAHHLVLSGNPSFIPTWFSLEQLEPVAPVLSVPPPAPELRVTGAQALRQIYDQRDAKREVRATLAQPLLKIGQSQLEISVESKRAGYVYVALAGSDDQALYLLFPNKLDARNAIKAGETVQLPRAGWNMRAAGPPGMDRVLVLVTDAPRKLESLAGAGPFSKSLNDMHGRAQLGALLSRANGNAPDAFGAAWIEVEEQK